jgi:hypothetical protein
MEDYQFVMYRESTFKHEGLEKPFMSCGTRPLLFSSGSLEVDLGNRISCQRLPLCSGPYN